MSDNRRSIYEDNNRLIFRASSLSRCDTALLHSAFDSPRAPTPDFMQRAFDEGHDGEAEVLRKFCEGDGWNKGSEMRFAGTWLDPKASRWKLLDPKDAKSYHDGRGNSFPHCELAMLDDDQFTVEIPCIGGGVIRGHMDGVAELYQRTVEKDQPDNLHADTLGKRVIVEAKLFGPDYWDKWCRNDINAFPDYAMQISEYGFATGLDVVFIVGRKERQYEVPGDKSSQYLGFEVKDVHITYIKNGDLPVPIGQIKARVFGLTQKYKRIVAGEDEMPDCVGVKTSTGKFKFPDYPCDYYQVAHVEPGEQGGFNTGEVVQESFVELVKGTDKDKPAPIPITDEADRQALDSYGTLYLEATKQEGELKKAKAGYKEEVDEILNKYRARDDEGKIVPGGVFESNGVIVEWSYSFTEGGQPTVTKSRTVNTPKFKVKGES